jgi:hypothetical protein
MSAREGLPDFQRLLGSGTTQFYAPFGAGPFAVLPSGARVAVQQGQPVFSLTLVRRPDQPGPTGNYAVLDVQLTDDVPLDDALALARGISQSATVAPAAIELGFIRLTPGGPGISLPSDMTTPVPLGWSAASGGRWTQHLDVDTGELIKSSLQGGTLLFSTRMEFTIRGVAPRIAASVEFAPAALVPALLAGGTTIGVPQLIERLTDPALPLTLTGSETRGAVAVALADRLATAFGSFVAAAGASDPPCFGFDGPLPAEQLTWDLSLPAEAVHAFVLQLDPLKGLREFAGPPNLVHEVTIPPLDLGFREIVVTANLPPNRVGLPAIGVRISLPPNPPDRPSGINETAIFTAPDDQVRLSLRLGSDEPLNYTATPFAIVAAGPIVQQLDGTPRQASGAWLHLQPADFSLAFAHIVASDRLVAQATVSGALTYPAGTRTATQPIALRPGAADVAVAAPAGAANPVIVLTATEPGGEAIELAPQPPGVIRLDLPSLPGYGPHRIPLACAFVDGATPLTVELQSEDGITQSSITLTQAAPAATWGYVANSPFRAGFRARPAGGTWSAVLPPTRTLTFSPGGNTMDAPIAPFDIEGVHLSPSANGATILYVPAAPTPELDPNGRPTLSVFKMPQATTLQLGAHFSLSAADLATLEGKVGAQYPSLRAATLQPAPIQVQKAAVVLADSNGAQTELGTSSTSAFPPYAAVFSLTLTPAQAAQAISAVGGRQGVLFVDYTILPQGAKAPAVSRCDVATWFHGTDGLSHVRSLG